MSDSPTDSPSRPLLPHLLQEAVQHFGKPERSLNLQSLTLPELVEYLPLAVRSAVVNRLFQSYASHLVHQLSDNPSYQLVLPIYLSSESNLNDLTYIKSFHPSVFHSLGFPSSHLPHLPHTTTQLSQNLSSVLSRFESHQSFLTNIMLSSRNQIFETNLTSPSDKLDALLALEGYAFVCGPEFSGKSHFVSNYVRAVVAVGTPHAVITVDKTTDLLSLLGNYVIHTSDTEAHFEWKEGAFVKALRKGSLCVLENFELATDQLKSFISATLQTKSIKIKNKTVHFHQNFRVIVVGRDSDSQHIEQSLFLPKMSLNAYLDTILDKSGVRGQAKAATVTLATVLSLLGEAAGMHKMGRFAKRMASLFTSLNLTDSSRLFLSSQTQTVILLHILEVFFDNTISEFLSSEVFEPICHQLGLKGSAATPMIQAYETTVKLDSNSLQTLRFHTNIPNPVGFSKDFVLTDKSKRLVESILGCVVNRENTLLVGETGCGKTTVVQELARLFNKKLNVFNLSHTTDAFDMFGGYRPVNQDISFRHQIDQFESVLNDHFSVDKNSTFLTSLRSLLDNKDYSLLAKGLIQASERVIDGLNSKVQKLKSVESQTPQSVDLITQMFESKERFESILSKNTLYLSSSVPQSDPNATVKKGINLEFIKGVILQSIERNEWLLLDEINLAGEEVLSRLYQVLFSDKIFLSDAAELTSVHKHPEFRLFACMNPAFEVGKKPLPKRIKEGFTTLVVSPIDSIGEVHAIVSDFFAAFQMISGQQLLRLAEFYCRIRLMAIESGLLDKQDKKVVFTMRQLRRATQIIKECLTNQSVLMSPLHAIYVGCRLSFLLDLNLTSKVAFNSLFCELFEIKDIEKTYLDKSFYRTSRQFELSSEYIVWQDFPLRKALTTPLQVIPSREGKQSMVITPNIRTIICDLMRVLLYDRSRPLLLEGPTSVGKTSIVVHLASLIGQKVVRLNNHRDTDLDEYIGSYVPDQTGQIRFQEGVLLQCMREGSWLLLDELNLARSEILEALNRVLDDNQELFVPELDAMIKPTPGFRIFATQNPNSYSGRSLLSTAFRNRFIVVNFDSHDHFDLKAILMAKEAVPESRAKVMLKIMASLETMRSVDKMFEGKQGLITIRDLLKWGARRDESVSFLNLALAGYYLLGERVRDPIQKRDIKELMGREAGVVLGDDVTIYSEEFTTQFSQIPQFQSVLSSFDIQLNTQFKRIFCLTSKAFENKEPVLLIGQTGCGKTTLAQMMAKILGVPFYSLNCHKHTEVSDFLGGWKPSRGKDNLMAEAVKVLKENLSKRGNQLPEITNVNDLETIVSIQRENLSKQIVDRLSTIISKLKSEFEWVEGNLVEAVRSGGIYLIDEISLANDSVLERLNSLLESTRELSIQQGDQDFLTMSAHPNFHIIATMNPSGDYGKRELSPALRNRFTEIWATSVLDADNFSHEIQSSEVKEFIDKFVQNSLRKMIIPYESVSGHLQPILGYLWDLLHLVNGKYQTELRPLNMRDLATFCQLVGSNWSSLGPQTVMTSSCVVFETLISTVQSQDLAKLLQKDFVRLHETHFSLNSVTLPSENLTLDFTNDQLTLGGIRINSVDNRQLKMPTHYFLEDSHVKQTLFRLLLGLQSNKPILIEGESGTGKTSLIEVLGHMLGHQVFKVNLSEQTDLIDLLGSYVPDEARAGFFSWKDGLLLRALKDGAWIIFDELNLANQTVLEGLNSILDHRGQVFLPDLNATVSKQSGFRFFGCQNPAGTSGSRKGLPASFLNRFFKIFTHPFPKSSVTGILGHVANGLGGTTEVTNFVIKMLFQDSFGGDKGSVKDAVGLWKTLGLRQLLKVLAFTTSKLSLGNDKSSEQKVSLMGRLVLDLFVIGQFGPDASPILPIICSYFDSKGVHLSFGHVQSTAILNGRETSLCCYSVNHPNTFFASDFFGKLSKIETVPLKPLSKLIFALSCSLQLNFPIILESKSHSHSLLIHQLLQAMAKSRQSRLRGLLLYKSADIADLIGNYEQCNWEVAYKKLVKETRNLEVKVSEDSVDVPKIHSEVADSETRKLKALVVLGKLRSTLESLQSNDLPTKNLIQRIVSLENVVKTEKSLFMWTFSPLLKALMNGDWIVVSGCEQASPAVLEKLNGLLDDNEFYVNECFDKSGNPLKVRKHPNARVIFLFESINSKDTSSSRPTSIPPGFQSRCFTVKVDEYLEGLEESAKTVARTQLQMLLRLSPVNVLPLEYIRQGMSKEYFSRQNVVKLVCLNQKLQTNLALMFDQPLPFLTPPSSPSSPVTTLPLALEGQVIEYLKHLLMASLPADLTGHPQNGGRHVSSFDLVTSVVDNESALANLRTELSAQLTQLLPHFNWETKVNSIESPHLSLIILKLIRNWPNLTQQLLQLVIVTPKWEDIAIYLQDCAISAKNSKSFERSSAYFGNEPQITDEKRLLEMMSLRLVSPRLPRHRLFTPDSQRSALSTLLTDDIFNAKERLVAHLNPNLSVNFIRLATTVLSGKSTLSVTSLERKVIHQLSSSDHHHPPSPLPLTIPTQMIPMVSQSSMKLPQLTSLPSTTSSMSPFNPLTREF